MRAGRLKTKAIIEQKTTIPNEYGESVASWEKFADIYCSLLPFKAKEKFASNQKLEIELFTMNCRFIKNIDMSMRVNIDKKIYKINSCINVGNRNKTLEMILEYSDGKYDN